MTVKVLKGAPVFTVVKACPGCKAELEASEPDLKVGFFGPSWGGETPEKSLYFECPVCCTDIKVSEAPRTLLSRIEKRDKK